VPKGKREKAAEHKQHLKLQREREREKELKRKERRNVELLAEYDKRRK
jgi:hypothetical protein